MEFPSAVRSSCGSFAFTRLNADSSWLIEHLHPHSLDYLDEKETFQEDEICWKPSVAPDTKRKKCSRIILDPWFENSEGIDGCPCFSATWPQMETTAEPDAIFDSMHIDAIIVSLPFADHCHKDTLLKLPPKIPIFAANGAYRKILKFMGGAAVAMRTRFIYDLSVEAGREELESRTRLKFSPIQSKFGRYLDPTHKGIQLTNDDGHTIIYAPHGLRLSTSQIKTLQQETKSICLFSTTKLYQLPLILGGTVNLGYSNAIQVIKSLKEHVIDFFPTHSFRGKVTGFVSYLSSVSTAPDDQVMQSKISVFRIAMAPRRISGKV